MELVLPGNSKCSLYTSVALDTPVLTFLVLVWVQSQIIPTCPGNENDIQSFDAPYTQGSNCMSAKQALKCPCPHSVMRWVSPPLICDTGMGIYTSHVQAMVLLSLLWMCPTPMLILVWVPGLNVPMPDQWHRLNIKSSCTCAHP